MKLKGLNSAQVKDLVSEGVILLGYRGSVAHGAYTPSYGTSEHDDKDIMGVAIPPIENYFGLSKQKTRERMITGSDGVMWDSITYTIEKFVSLLLKGNPNVLSLLWLPEHLYILATDEGRQLIDNRDLFISKNVYRSFAGYAAGQLHRMTHINTSDLGAKRKELVAEFGYDTKNAGHLIRLLRMGIEFLTDGELYVVREDAAELIEIKKGEWSKEKILREADRLFALAQEAFVRSPLPAKPDYERAEALLVNILSNHWKAGVVDSSMRGVDHERET